MLQPHEIKFSAVIPTYNRARLAERAITSVIHQSHSPAEIIVVDDGSTDDTEGVVRRFGRSVRYVRQQNSGGAAARNRGVVEARHPWVAFLDSDDLWTTSHLERIAGAIAATGGAAGLYFDDMLVSESPDATWWETGGFAIQGDHLLVPDAADWVLREYQPMMLQSTVCLRSTYLEEGGLWENLRNAHDTHFFLKMGIGKSACAVQGIGSKLTADAPAEGRLTSAGQEKRRYLNKITAFRDILRKYPRLTWRQRRCLRERIATSHWTLGRFAWEDRQLFHVGTRIAQALWAEPGTTVRLAASILHRSAGLASPRAVAGDLSPGHKE